MSNTTQHVPKPGYKHTKFGVIPVEWKVVRLEEVLSLLKNGLSYRQNKSGTGYPVTRIETISDGVIDSNKVGYLDKLSEKEIINHKLEIGDILFSHINSVKHIGKTAMYFGSPSPLIHGMNLLLLRPNKEMLESLFLLFFFKYDVTRNRLRSWAKQAVNQASINQTEMNSFRIQLPPLAEQQKIADILATVDEAIQTTTAVIAETTRLKQGLMQQLLTKGIDLQTRKKRSEYTHEFKDSPVGRIPKEWEVVLLDDVTKRGSGHTPNKKKSEYWNGGIKWVSLADSSRLDNGFISETDKEISQKGLDNSSAVLHPEGTVILSRDAGVGKSAILKEEMAVSQHFMAWRCDERMVSWFLYHLLQHWKPIFESIAIGSTIKTIGLHYFKGLKVPYPSTEEQQKIAEILLIVDEKVQMNLQYKNKLIKLKKGLMQQLLTGKTRVRVN